MLREKWLTRSKDKMNALFAGPEGRVSGPLRPAPRPCTLKTLLKSTRGFFLPGRRLQWLGRLAEGEDEAAAEVRAGGLDAVVRVLVPGPPAGRPLFLRRGHGRGGDIGLGLRSTHSCAWREVAVDKRSTRLHPGEHRS
jgi:hypothetical protein